MSGLQERFGRALNISTRSPGSKANQVEQIDKASLKPPKRITPVANFDYLYGLGKEVMPCGHKHMAVHFAKRRTDGLECVVKISMKPHCFTSQREERTWRRSTEYLLNMPRSDNIARIYEVLEDSRALYIVMERVNGMDLFEALQQSRPAVEIARDIIQQLLRAMSHLHAHSAVHKDLKLENVMIDSSECSPNSPSGGRSPSLSPNSVKVIDFDTVDQWAPSSPVGKDVVGTDQYIAQEAYAGKYSPLSDVFAIGVIAYRLLTGKLPFQAELFDDGPGENWVGSPKMLEIRQKLQTAKVNFSHSVFKQHPAAADLVQRMLSHREGDRPSASAALKHPWFAEDTATSPVGPSSPKDVLTAPTLLTGSTSYDGYCSPGGNRHPKVTTGPRKEMPQAQQPGNQDPGEPDTFEADLQCVRSRSAVPTDHLSVKQMVQALL